MKQLDTYLTLCTQVYELSKSDVPKDAYNFYKSYLSNAHGAILEPMCGSGRFLLPFLLDGFKVDGFDASESMLTALREKAKLHGLTPNVWQGYVEQQTGIEKVYDLIFIPSGSFGLLIDETSIIEALKIFHTMLDNNGILIFEVETLAAAPSQFGVSRSFVYKREDDRMIIATFFDLPLKNNVGTSICRYELVQNNQITKTEIEELKVRFYDPNSLVLKLKDAGFSEVTLRKPFDCKVPSDHNDETVVYECRK